ncbi:hypothetical protein [Dickeya zeae]|uniref:Uncharacterized protein n=1 Tax=Dickeya zeae TaxID=204042 RepID=A0AAE7CY77_9GAMM|nr:hypothetical protein [Dickeya zeae]MCO7260571.1 hypothetical protein [Dickeya zeae]QIZ50616.1 hypothetical protein DWG24_07400 [Dickeya zeae]QYM90381.1 hypothetical protein FGI21_00090 [Dickeya zeae]
MTTENTDVDRLAAYERSDEVTSAQQKTATANAHEACCALNQQWPDSLSDKLKRCLKTRRHYSDTTANTKRRQTAFIAAKRLF